MQSLSGTYALVLRSKRRSCIQVGRWGELDILPGYYIYVGSAFGPGGVRARVSRHCREAKAKHWHIDYLREVTRPVTIWCSYDAARLEHRWAGCLKETDKVTPIYGFGSTDCQCESHLFYSARSPDSSMLGDPIEVCSCE